MKISATLAIATAILAPASAFAQNADGRVALACSMYQTSDKRDLADGKRDGYPIRLIAVLFPDDWRALEKPGFYYTSKDAQLFDPTDLVLGYVLKKFSETRTGGFTLQFEDLPGDKFSIDVFGQGPYFTAIGHDGTGAVDSSAAAYSGGCQLLGPDRSGSALDQLKAMPAVRIKK